MKKRMDFNMDEVSVSDRERFRSLCHDAMLHERQEGEGGIGTLAEKRMHAILKHYISFDPDTHEVGVKDTRYVSDVRVGDHIYEIQSGSFYPMHKKIAYYMEHTDCHVTVVHPVVIEKTVSWVDPETHEISPPKKSPKHESPVLLLPELYCMREHLNNPRLSFHLLLIHAQDFRMLDGRSRDKKRGSHRYERIPTELIGQMRFDKPSDFERLLPSELPSPFAVKDFKHLSHLRSRPSYGAVYVLEALGLIEPTDPIGRAKAFRIKSEAEKNLKKTSKE